MLFLLLSCCAFATPCSHELRLPFARQLPLVALLSFSSLFLFISGAPTSPVLPIHRAPPVPPGHSTSHAPFAPCAPTAAPAPILLLRLLLLFFLLLLSLLLLPLLALPLQAVLLPPAGLTGGQMGQGWSLISPLHPLLHCTLFYYTPLLYIVLHYIALHYTALHCISLCCPVHCTVLVDLSETVPEWY